MDWREVGVAHKIEGGVLWMNPRTPFLAELVHDAFDEWEIDVSSSTMKRAAGWGFVFIEGYLLEVEGLDDNHPINLYLQNRGECDLKDRWVLFQTILSSKEFSLLSDAYNKTRPTELQIENGIDPDEKKSATSKKRKNTPKVKESATES